jgi:ElaB/YqjD/DUF883 family membrane-anchored ribosome-binding protein
MSTEKPGEIAATRPLTDEEVPPTEGVTATEGTSGPTPASSSPGTPPTPPEPAERSPAEIERDIEATREEMGDTVAAVADKADVKKQASEKVAEVKEKVGSKAEELAGKAKGAAPESAGEGMQQAQSAARENPIPVIAAAAFVAGVVVGRLLSRR